MKKNIKSILGVILLLFTINSCTDLDDNEPVDLTKDTIKKDSELFRLLESVVNSGDDPVENTVCIDFIYPFKVFIYNVNLLPESEIVLYGDEQFSAFLEQLPPNQSISISYPLQTTLPDGTIFSVTNNAELKIALDSCSREDIISTCNGLFCSSEATSSVWKVPYIENSNNDYAGAVFTPNLAGSITLFHLNNSYIGTWNFLFLNNELHLNINLSGTSTTAQNWNYDYKITNFTGDSMQLEVPSISRILEKEYASAQLYTIGQMGPAGGIIAYDKGEFSNGWRYIEAATQDITSAEWGCINGQITDAGLELIGSGYQNSVAIANFHNNLINYYTNPSVCSSSNNGTVAAKNALNLVNGSKNDWFLPSKLELLLLYNNLHSIGQGNFSNAIYWSSTEESLTKVKCINFINGQTVASDKNTALIKTRPIRYF